jgi:hypothetical protein
MPPAEFDALVPREFGFSASMARKLMVIAKDERIANCFDGMLREGSINPSMTNLVADSAIWLEKHRRGAHLGRLPKKLAKAPPRPTKGTLAAPPRPLPLKGRRPQPTPLCRATLPEERQQAASQRSGQIR